MLGKTGLLGGYFFDCLLSLNPGSFYAPLREELDILNYADVKEYISHLKPDVVINCTGYTAVDDAEEHKEEALRCNAEAVGNLASCCKESGSVLVHFSTDYVFDGQNKDGYFEDAPTNPLNAYGESKLEGEKAIIQNTDKYYIIRTAWLFGKYGKNFVDTMLALADQKKELNVVGDQLGSPTYAKDLAQFVFEHLLNAPKLPFGIYHITNSGVCSWYQLAEEIFKIAKKDIILNQVDSSAFPRPAKRPAYSILLSKKNKNSLRSWKEALETYLAIAK